MASARTVVFGVGCELGELVECLFCGLQVAVSELYLDEQAEQGRAVRIGRRASPEAQADEILCQGKFAASEGDLRERPPGARVPVDPFQQTFGFLEPSLPDV